MQHTMPYRTVRYNTTSQRVTVWRCISCSGRPDDGALIMVSYAMACMLSSRNWSSRVWSNRTLYDLAKTHRALPWNVCEICWVIEISIPWQITICCAMVYGVWCGLLFYHVVGEYNIRYWAVPCCTRLDCTILCYALSCVALQNTSTSYQIRPA